MLGKDIEDFLTDLAKLFLDLFAVGLDELALLVLVL